MHSLFWHLFYKIPYFDWNWTHTVLITRWVEHYTTETRWNKIPYLDWEKRTSENCISVLISTLSECVLKWDHHFCSYRCVLYTKAFVKFSSLCIIHSQFAWKFSRKVSLFKFFTIFTIQHFSHILLKTNLLNIPTIIPKNILMGVIFYVSVHFHTKPPSTVSIHRVYGFFQHCFWVKQFVGFVLCVVITGNLFRTTQ